MRTVHTSNECFCFLSLSTIHRLFLVLVELTSNACWKNLVFCYLYRKYSILCYSCIVMFEGISCDEFTIMPLLLYLSCLADTMIV